MNKILKIIIKSDPIFRYVVEDYPFYEGIFFHLTDFYTMKILNAHYLLRRSLGINQGKTQNFYNIMSRLKLAAIIDLKSTKIKIYTRFSKKSKANLNEFNHSKVYIRLNLRLKTNHRDYSKNTVNLHTVKLIRLKTHDPYALENRDMLTLGNMDEEKIL